MACPMLKGACPDFVDGYPEGYAVWNFHYSMFTFNKLSFDIWEAAIDEEWYAIYQAFAPDSSTRQSEYRRLFSQRTLNGMIDARAVLLKIIDDIAVDRHFCKLMCAVNAYLDYV